MIKSGRRGRLRHSRPRRAARRSQTHSAMHSAMHSAVDYADRRRNETPVHLPSKAGPSGGVAMLMLCCITHASGQTAPSFRSDPQIQLVDSSAGAAETTPAGDGRRGLFSALPEFRPQLKGVPGLPQARAPMPGTAQNTAWPGAPLRLGAPAAGSARSAAPARSPETPIALQRRPGRNLGPQDGTPAFTLRSTSDAKVLAELSIGLQGDTRHTDNLANTRRSRAIEDVIMEWRPILQLDMGSPPAGHVADSFSTEYFLRLRYVPTLHTLLDAGTTTTLQRISGEIGRVSPVLTSLVRFEYDENIFGALGDNTVEESNTVTEVSPLIEYNLSAKTALRAEGTWRRIAPQNSITQRSEYILETGIVCAGTPKTTLGAGLEFGHIRFDEARFGVQNYEQIFATVAWLASPKVRFQTRAGVELRQFDTPVRKTARVSPVATLIVNWFPDERTELNAGFLLRNQPSVSQTGATFQEIRLGADVRHQVAWNFYVRGEAAIIRRAYDTGTRELEAVVRPAFGFHTHTSRLFDSLNVEIYYQFRRVDSNRRDSDRDRNILGIESTLYF